MKCDCGWLNQPQSHFIPTRLWRWNRQSVPKRNLNYRHRRIAQKKAYNKLLHAYRPTDGQTWGRLSTGKMTHLKKIVWGRIQECMVHKTVHETVHNTPRKCLEHYLLILRRRYTNGTWYIAAPGLEWNSVHSNPDAANWHYMHVIYQVPFV
jgi:hypothetical protein